MDLIKFRNLNDFIDYKNTTGASRSQVEKMMADDNKRTASWDSVGYCEVCEKGTHFLIDWLYSDKVVPNFRERLVCKHCGLNNRQRFIFSYCKKLLKDQNLKDIYLYEQVTDFYKSFSDIFSNYNVIGSEYLGYDKKPGEIINKIRNEDATNLSFDDYSFDLLISNDVFEHVPNIHKVFEEACRVLRENGKLLFSIPFYCTEQLSRKRATLDENGTLTTLLPEIYHGNPISKDGSLVFNDFGWDILDICKGAGFKDAYLLGYYSMLYGYLGEGLQFMFVAEK